MKRLLSFVAALSLCAGAHAASYPSRPIRLELPYSPGGGADVVGRPLAEALTKVLKTSVIVENRGGASGIIAMNYVKHATADGYTLVLPLTAQVAVNQNLFKTLPYDPLTDFEPIALLGKAPYYLTVNPSLPAKNLQEFIALAKQDPGKYSYASTGSGSGLHLSMELLKSMAGINIAHIPYKGGGDGIADLLAGRVQAMFLSAGSAKGLIDAGKLRAIAVTTKTRSPVYPDVPTIAESGLPAYESDVWYALMAPKGTPPEVVKTLHDAVMAALKDPVVTREFAVDGIEAVGSTPEQLRDFIVSESDKWKQVMQRAGVEQQ